MLILTSLLYISDVLTSDDKKEKEEKEEKCMNTLTFADSFKTCNDPFDNKKLKKKPEVNEKCCPDCDYSKINEYCESDNSKSSEEAETSDSEDEIKSRQCRPLKLTDSCAFKTFDASPTMKNKEDCQDDRSCRAMLSPLCFNVKLPICIEIDEICYIKFMQYLECKYKIKYDQEVKDAIRLVISELQECEENMIMFLAHATFNTGGFQCFVNDCEGRFGQYKSRGLLMISGEGNYCILDSFSSGYIESPEKLECLDSDAIGVTIKFWKECIGNFKNFGESTVALAPDEVQPGNKWDSCMVEKLENRYKIYDEIRMIFCQCSNKC